MDTGSIEAGRALIDLVSRRGGVLMASQRSIGGTLGWSKSRTGEVLHALAAAGRVRLTTTSRGTVVQYCVFLWLSRGRLISLPASGM